MLNVTIDTQLNTFHLNAAFTAEMGKTTVLLGESGAGKSTILRVLAGLLHPEQGHISLNGVTYFDSQRHISVPPQERPFGYVFQDYVLFPHLTVFENVAFGLRAQRFARTVVRQRVTEALERVRLVGFDQRRPAQLSGGQQQRVAIARVLALQPELLLLDEPLSALDVQTRREVRQELRRILLEVGITTVMVTHHYLEALLFGQQILVLDDGRVVQRGGQRDLLAYPRSSYIAELIGVNFFQGHILDYEPDLTCVIRLKGGIDVLARLREHEQAVAKCPSLGSEVFIVVDPCNVTLYQTPPDSSARNLFCGRIVQVLRLRANGMAGGDGHVRVNIALDGVAPPLIAEVTETSAQRMDLHEGKVVYAAFKASEASAYL